MGPELQYANERAWDPLSFDTYPGDDGVVEMELTDDHRRLQFTMTIDRAHLRLDGGPLEYGADVRVHRSGRPLAIGRIGQTIDLS
jgi:hypothetical protein